MKFVKMLGLAAVAVTAILAFVGTSTSSADVMCTILLSPCPEIYTVKKVAKISIQKKAASSRMENTSGTTITTCTGGEAGTGEVKQGKGIPITGEIAEFTWSGCTSTTDTVKLGSIEIKEISGTGEGTVILKSTEFTVVTFGVSCTYGAGTGTDIGTLASVTEPEEEALLTVNAVLNKTAGSFLCPQDVRWKEVRVLTSHKVIYTVLEGE